MTRPSDALVVGAIVKAQGIQGEVKVRAETSPERFLGLAHVFVGEEDEPRRIAACRVQDGMAVLAFLGVTSRTDAELLRGKLLYAAREDLPPLDEGAYYICDLIGCEVRADGTLLGRIADVAQAGGNDVWFVAGERPFCFPALRSVLLSVDTAARRVDLNAARLHEVAVFDD